MISAFSLRIHVSCRRTYRRVRAFMASRAWSRLSSPASTASISRTPMAWATVRESGRGSAAISSRSPGAASRRRGPRRARAALAVDVEGTAAVSGSAAGGRPQLVPGLRERQPSCAVERLQGPHHASRVGGVDGREGRRSSAAQALAQRGGVGGRQRFEVRSAGEVGRPAEGQAAERRPQVEPRAAGHDHPPAAPQHVVDRGPRELGVAGHRELPPRVDDADQVVRHPGQLRRSWADW